MVHPVDDNTSPWGVRYVSGWRLGHYSKFNSSRCSFVEGTFTGYSRDVSFPSRTSSSLKETQSRLFSSRHRLVYGSYAQDYYSCTTDTLPLVLYRILLWGRLILILVWVSLPLPEFLGLVGKVSMLVFSSSCSYIVSAPPQDTPWILEWYLGLFSSLFMTISFLFNSLMTLSLRLHWCWSSLFSFLKSFTSVQRTKSSFIPLFCLRVLYPFGNLFPCYQIFFWIQCRGSYVTSSMIFMLWVYFVWRFCLVE